MSIRELARHLNVSIGTVSRALNGRSDVSEETRQRVLAAADALGYSPNQSGRSLRQGVTGMVALILPTSGKTALADTIFMSVLEGLRAFLDDRKLDLMVLLSGPEENAYAYLRRVAARRLADGLIIAETQRLDPRIDYLLEKDIPFVAFGRSRSGSGYPWIDLDFEGVAEAAVAHLAGLGHRRIAVATAASDINYSFVFADAFEAAMRGFGLPFDPALVLRVENSDDGGYAFGNLIFAMPEPPTAVVLVNEFMAIGLYRSLKERGLTPGRDLSIVGFQEEPNSRLLAPPVTCFRTALPDLGARLGEALLATIPAHAPPETAGTIIQELWPMEFAQGQSDGPPRS
ncbi:MAG: substrate-binding domain-containing protein [Bauldia sp.]|nr:substrate-binding domain-containing protein [Bauldia sp.]